MTRRANTEQLPRRLVLIGNLMADKLRLAAGGHGIHTDGSAEDLARAWERELEALREEEARQ